MGFADLIDLIRALGLEGAQAGRHRMDVAEGPNRSQGRAEVGLEDVMWIPMGPRVRVCPQALPSRRWTGKSGFEP